MMTTLALSMPNRKPSCRMTAARPFSLRRYMIADIVSRFAARQIGRKMILHLGFFPNRRMEDSSKLQIPGHLPYSQAHLAGTYYHGIHTGHPNHTATLLSHNSPHFLYYILTDLRGGQSWAKHMCLSESPYSTIFTDPYIPASLPRVAKAKRASSEAWKASSTKCFLMLSSRISPALDTPPPIT